jgi:hypothetical protein
MTDAEHFKAWLRSRNLTYRDAAEANHRSVGWISEVARGHYPWYMAGKVPVGIWRWAVSLGMPDNVNAQAAP